MTDPTSRVLDLLSLLQTHRFWSGVELSDRLGVSARTLRRDVDRLRSLGYPVDATPGAAGGYRLAAGAHMPPLLLDDEEAIAIAVGLRAAAGAAIEGIEETSVRAMAKLDQVLPDRLRRRVAAVHSNVVSLRWGSWDGPMVDPEDLAVLSQACRDHEQARFEYERADGETSRRLVEPHALVSAGRRWYLAAWDVRREDWRTFRLDRLRDARLAGVRFTPRELPAADAAEYVARSLSARPSRHEAKVLVQGSAEDVEPVARWAGGEVEAVDGSSCTVTLGADWIDWLAVGVSSIAMRFEVQLLEAPPELVEQLSAMCTRLGPAIDGARPGG